MVKTMLIHQEAMAVELEEMEQTEAERVEVTLVVEASANQQAIVEL